MPHKVAALFAAAAMFTFGEIVTLPSPVCRVKLIADRFRIGGAGTGRASSPDAGPAQIGQKEIVERSLFMLWIIVLILVILAVGGGLAVSNLVWLLLVVALIVAVFALMSGRRV